MAFDDLTDLKAALASWSARSDLTGVLSDFVALSEARINRDLRVRDMVTQATGSLTAGESTLAQPDDFLQVDVFQVSSSPTVVLEYRPAGEAVAVDGNGSGVPRVFAIIGTNFEILPAPDSGYTYTLDYYASLPPLETEDTNWLLEKAPDVYLHAGLVELWNYLQDDAMAARHATFYQAAIDRLMASDQRARVSSYPMVARVA